jgi:opacity protein-like surface antigen
MSHEVHREGRQVNPRSPKSVLRRRSGASSWIRVIHATAVFSALGVIFAPTTATADPQTRGGFMLGLDFARGSAGVSSANSNSIRESGWGGGFRLGYAPNPKYAFGFENHNCLVVTDGSAFTLGTFTGTVSAFPVEGLVLSGGLGVGTFAGATSDFGGGLGGTVGTGWTLGAGYEFRVAHSFAVGPQLSYSGVNLQDGDFNFVNIAFGMTWYFIPE